MRLGPRRRGAARYRVPQRLRGPWYLFRAKPWYEQVHVSTLFLFAVALPTSEAGPTHVVDGAVTGSLLAVRLGYGHRRRRVRRAQWQAPSPPLPPGVRPAGVARPAAAPGRRPSPAAPITPVVPARPAQDPPWCGGAAVA